MHTNQHIICTYCIIEYAFSFNQIYLFHIQVSSNLSVPSFCFPDASVFKPGSVSSLRLVYDQILKQKSATKDKGAQFRDISGNPEMSVYMVACVSV